MFPLHNICPNVIKPKLFNELFWLLTPFLLLTGQFTVLVTLPGESIKPGYFLQ